MHAGSWMYDPKARFPDRRRSYYLGSGVLSLLQSMAIAYAARGRWYDSIMCLDIQLRVHPERFLSRTIGYVALERSIAESILLTLVSCRNGHRIGPLSVLIIGRLRDMVGEKTATW